MGRTRADIQKDINKFDAVRSKLQGDMEIIERNESEALGRIEGELLSTGSSEASNTLVELRVKKGVVSQELSILSTRLSGLRGELSDIDRAESTQPWTTFKAGLPPRIAKIRTLLNGLASEMDTMRKELDGISSAAERISQESAIDHRRLTNICVTGTTELNQLQKLLKDF